MFRNEIKEKIEFVSTFSQKSFLRYQSWEGFQMVVVSNTRNVIILLSLKLLHTWRQHYVFVFMPLTDR